MSVTRQHIFITTKEARIFSGYTTDYLAGLARAKKIKAKRVGRCWLIERGSLQSFVKRQEKHKEEQARSLNSRRLSEYRRHAKKTASPRTESTLVLLPEFFDPYSHRVRTEALAISVTCSVLFFSALVGYGLVPPAAQSTVVLIEKAQSGFFDTFGGRGGLSVAEPPYPENRALVPSLTETTHPSLATLALEQWDRPDLSSVHVPVGIRFYDAGDVSSSLPPDYSQPQDHSSYYETIGSLGSQMLAIAAETRDLVARMPQSITRLNLALGSSIISTTHSLIGLDTELAYVLADLAPKAAYRVVTAVGAIGDTLFSGAQDAVAQADVLYHKGSVALRDLGPSHLALYTPQGVYPTDEEANEPSLMLAAANASGRALEAHFASLRSLLKGSNLEVVSSSAPVVEESTQENPDISLLLEDIKEGIVPLYAKVLKLSNAHAGELCEANTQQESCITREDLESLLRTVSAHIQKPYKLSTVRI